MRWHLSGILGAILSSSTSAYGAAFFQYKTVIIPKDVSLDKGGEDSADCNEDTIAIADGVGGWALKGIDPAPFARELTNTVVQIAAQDHASKARQLLNLGCLAATASKQGSATATVIKLRDDMTLDAANLGDSGFAVFRADSKNKLKLVFQNKPSQIAFNMPHQCGGEAGDTWAEIEESVTKVKEADIVVAYTDGLADNVWVEDMPQCIEQLLEGGLVSSLSQAADCLARKASLLGKSPTYLSPFNVNWKQAFIQGLPMGTEPPAEYDFKGGKVDDVTVTVAQIFKASKVIDLQNDQRHSLAARDTYFPNAKTIYTEAVGQDNDHEAEQESQVVVPNPPPQQQTEPTSKLTKQSSPKKKEQPTQKPAKEANKVAAKPAITKKKPGSLEQLTAGRIAE